jgi:Holliday junction resolvase
MAVDPRAKGARAETVVKDALRKYTGLKWERVPGSGALNEKHGLKADLYVPNEKNLYAVEVKHYQEDHIDSRILTSKDPQLLQFWKQTIRQGAQVDKKPLLIFKFNRSKLFVAFEDMPSGDYSYIFISVQGLEFYVAVLEDWVLAEAPKFIA